MTAPGSLSVTDPGVPHSHPNQHTPEELKLISDMRRRNQSAGLVTFWVKLMQRGYKRSVTGLYRVLRRQGIMAVKPQNPKYVPKPYEQMLYPGQRFQIDVKYVPAVCLVNQAKVVLCQEKVQVKNNLFR